MPELPEVETTLRGIEPHLLHKRITQVIVRHPRLRWPIPNNLNALLTGQTIQAIHRRAKYILFTFKHGTLILHLGMSGRVRILQENTPPEKHDHVDIQTANCTLRFTDPRRFGAVLWTDEDPAAHPLLAHLGPEPLTHDFSGQYLWERSRHKTVTVKSFIMDSKVVVGVGNIYAAEALFLAGVHPKRAAGKVNEAEYVALVKAIKKILQNAIKQGGTTLKDFLKSDGKPGYFRVKLKVYGRDGEPCVNCGEALSHLRIGQRATVFCKNCQQ